MTSAIDVLTLGEAMASFRSAGPLAEGAALTLRVAGAESNVAIGLARLGHRVAWAGRVGADAFGSVVLRTLRAEGVDVACAAVDPQRQTGLMFVEHRTADLTRVDYRRSGSAGAALEPGDLEAALDLRPRWVHLSGVTPALSPSARAAALWAAERGRAAGARVSLDVNYRSRLWSREDARHALAPLAAHATLVIASEDELDLVATGPEDEAVARLFGLGAEQVAVKRGAAGATLHLADGRYDAAAVPVTAVDPIGAGDAFAAGFLSASLELLLPAECLARAVVTGAFAASSRGDWEGAPTRTELALLDGHVPGATMR